jgi:hypothetical protein
MCNPLGEGHLNENDVLIRLFDFTVGWEWLGRDPTYTYG